MSVVKTKKGKDMACDTSPEPTPCTSKSKKRRLSSDEDDDSGSPKRLGDHSTSKLGHNGLRSPTFTPHNKPAELFRKDLISAMKLADSEPLQEEYIFIADSWRQEWEKGVQVPVNPGEIPEIKIKALYPKPTTGDFKINPRKYLHAAQDETFRQGIHELTGMHQLSEQVVRYDLDDLDVNWLELANQEREEVGVLPVHEWTMERVIEALESQCHERIKDIVKTEEGLGIEYDENIVCEVCRSPDSEETNEMVFCDGCDICVHQACYGIQNIPDGRWLCRTCSLGIKPRCILCPRLGGAMKSTKSGTKWAHVSCALWIPEVSIGCVEKMEPITKISNIPASRWALVCCVCKDRVGSCIQCSVKTCKIAFHVTCAIFNGLEMKTILDESDDQDGVKLKAFCPRHSKKRERSQSDSEADSSPRKEAPLTPRKDLSKEEMANLRAKKMSELQNTFHKVVDTHSIAEQLSVEQEVVELIAVYWRLKRKVNFDKPLLMPKTEEADMLEKQQEDSLVARMKMFVHLRQDLERVRNLCYMISRREKTKRQYYKAREQAFFAAVNALTDLNLNLSLRESEKLVRKYTKNCLYEGYVKSNAVRDLSFCQRLFPSEDSESLDSDSRDAEHVVKSRKKSTKGKVVPVSVEDNFSAVERLTDEGYDFLSDESHSKSAGKLVDEEPQSDVSYQLSSSSNLLEKSPAREEPPNLVQHESLNEVVSEEEKGACVTKDSASQPGKRCKLAERHRGRRRHKKHKHRKHKVKRLAQTQDKCEKVDLSDKERLRSEIFEEVCDAGDTAKIGAGDGDSKACEVDSASSVSSKEKIVKSERTGREKVEKSRKSKSRSKEAESESEFVDVTEVDPPILSSSFHPNIEVKLEPEDPVVTEQIKVEDAAGICEIVRPRRSLRENRQQSDSPKIELPHTPTVSQDVEVEGHPADSPKKRHHHGHRRHRRSSGKKRERRSSASKEHTLRGVKSDINGVMKRSGKFVVEDSVKERVQNQLLKKRRLRYMNGIHDKSQMKLDSFLTRTADVGRNGTGSRILNEISPDKGKVPFENNLFGAHYIPKGSLSGYKIPKKGDSTDTTPVKSDSLEVKLVDSENIGKKGDVEKRRFFEDASFGSLNRESSFVKDMELVSDARGYRSHSPLSSESTDTSRRGDSREGTPRRVTRSQLVDVDENSVDSVHSAKSNIKVRLREGLLRPPNFTS